MNTTDEHKVLDQMCETIREAVIDATEAGASPDAIAAEADAALTNVLDDMEREEQRATQTSQD